MHTSRAWQTMQQTLANYASLTQLQTGSAWMLLRCT